MTDRITLQEELTKRLLWLEDKERNMRDLNSPDYTPNQLLQGRVQGQIGECTRLLRTLQEQ